MKFSDIVELQKAFNRVLAYSQNKAETWTIPLLASDLNTDQLFSDWWENKSWFYYEMDNRLTYEIPDFEVEIPWETIEQELLSSMNTLRYSGLNENLDDIIDFIIIHRDYFKDNILPEDIELPNGELVKKGTKATKALWKFNNSEKITRHLQDMISQLLQKRTLKGTLVFSIHPLDYLTLSENTHNWRSCHALDGEYKSGNIAYMADKSTIICYIKDPEEKQLEAFPEGMLWNSKKWRMLLFFSETKHTLFAGRQYPYNCGRPLLEKIRLAIKEHHLFNMETFEEWRNEYAPDLPSQPAYDRAFLQNGHWQILERLIEQDKNAHNFNDLLYSSVYKKPFYTYNTYYYDKNEVIHIGHEANCIRCGKGNIAFSEDFLCIPCEEEIGTIEEDFYPCDGCGRRTYSPNLTYDADNYDFAYCPECIEKRMRRN